MGYLKKCIEAYGLNADEELKKSDGHSCFKTIPQIMHTFQRNEVIKLWLKLKRFLGFARLSLLKP